MVMLLTLVASTALADYNNCGDGPFEARRWFITPKIGVAPTIFGSKKTHEMFVVPFAAIDPTLCGEAPRCNIDNYENVLQEGPCLGKFSDLFHQGVLHVGFEVGRNICDRSAVFVEFVYNRASGKSACWDPFITNQARPGCSRKDCDTNCSSSNDCNSCDNDSCCPTGPTLSAIQSVRDDYGNYQAYAGYIGGRHFTNRFWCDSTSFWYGYKVGIIHRNRVDACTNIVYNVNTEANIGCNAPAGETQEQTFNRAVFCQSNSVSGGFQVGFDYCYNDCMSFQLGFEVVASCGLRGNKNHVLDVSSLRSSRQSLLVECSAIPTNIIICDTGAVVNFPIWLGLRWEFGGFGCCERRCE